MSESGGEGGMKRGFRVSVGVWCIEVVAQALAGQMVWGGKRERSVPNAGFGNKTENRRGMVPEMQDELRIYYFQEK